MAAKDPHVVLGVVPGASPDEIKAAWRRLARQHHPDLIGDDPEAAHRATRRMAEINTAYAALTRAGETTEGIQRRDRPSRASRDAARPPRSGPPLDRPTRPVTGRVDTTDTFLPRNQTVTPPGIRLPLTGQPPLRSSRSQPELRASQPSGPLVHDVRAGHVPPAAPDLDEALQVEVAFGKFHGHTLGEIAAFEPSYIDWLAGTIIRDPDLAMAARVIRAELDRRGVHRQHRPSRAGWQSNPYR
jgi:hypothetical protein